MKALHSHVLLEKKRLKTSYKVQRKYKEKLDSEEGEGRDSRRAPWGGGIPTRIRHERAQGHFEGVRDGAEGPLLEAANSARV